MKRIASIITVAVGVALLGGVALAQMGGPRGGGWGGMGPHMWGGPGAAGPGVNCPGLNSEAAQVTDEKAKALAQEYADKYLAGFTVQRVLPFEAMRGKAYSVELKNAQGEVRTLHVNPSGAIRPFGPHARRGV